MNGRPDNMIRPPGMHLPQNMLAMGQQFQQQSGPQTQGQPQHIINNMNANMGFLPSGQSPNPGASQYSMGMAQAQNEARRRQMLGQAQNAQGGNPQVNGPSGPNGMGQSQLQQVAFPGNIVQQGGQPVRRVASQPGPGPMNHAGVPMNGLHSGPQGMSVGGGTGLGINMPGGMNGQMRPSPQQQHLMNMRTGPPPQQQPMQGQLSPGVALSRTGLVQGMPPGVSRNPGGPPGMMNNVQQLPGQPHPGGLQPGLQQHGFQNLAMPPQQQPLGPSSSQGSLSQNQIPQSTIPMQQVVERARIGMTPENPAMFMNFQNQFPHGVHPQNRTPGSNSSQFDFVPSSTPPNPHVDLSQGLGGGGSSSAPPGSATRTEFHLTPAQQFAEMQHGGGGAGGGASSGGSGGGGGNPPDGFTHFGMQPPRPPSSQHPSLGHPQPSQHQQPHQQSSHPPQPPQPPHLSPQHQNRQVNGHVPHPARPQSQPQPPGRPPSQQTAPSRTPHLPHSSLPANATLLQAANIGGHPPPQRPPSHPGMPPTTPLGPPGPQPPQAQPPIPSQMMRPTGPQPVPSTPTTEGGIMRGLPGPVVPPVRPMQPPPPIGFGQGLVRLLQFSGSLASEHRDRLQLTHWEELVKDYFLPMATLKLTLWKDNQKNEAKVFEVGTPILPRFFLVTSQSGVKSMTLSLDGARERLYAQNQAVVECTSAVWTYRYYNGYTVTLRGPFTAHVLVVPTPPANGAPAQSTSHPNYSIKIYNIHFDSNLYEKHISVDVILGQRIDSPKTPRQRNAQTPTLNGVTPQQKAEEEKWEEPRIVFDRASIPSEPVNAFGIPQATMRCLELAESVGQMTELIQFSMEADCGPLESLKQFAQKIRETPVPGSLNTPGGPPNGIGMPGSYNTDGIMVNGGVPQNSTLYPPTPMSGPPGSAGGPQPGGSLPPATPSTSSPGKSKNGTPQQSHAPNPATSGSSSAHTPNTTSTPSMANATLTNNNLKRKAQPSETASPTTASSDQPPPAKRNQRKRGRTTGGG